MKATFGLALLLATLASEVGGQDIIRLNRDGAPGVGLTGNANSRSHVFYRSPDNERVRAAVWEGEPNTYPLTAEFTEFVYVLEGSLILTDASGREETFHVGEAVLIPRGTVYTWKQNERMREYYVIFDVDTSQEQSSTGGERPTFIRLDPNGGARGLVGEGRTRSRRYFAGPDGSSVGVWETDPHTASDFSKPKYSELMVFLSGTVTLTQPDGSQQTFQAGDAALVPRGAEYKWSSDTVRKFWVIFDQEPTSTDARR